MYAVLADGVLVFHFAYVLFVVFGGLLVLKWPRLAWLHLPAAAWGAAVQFGGWLCPLTPLENRLRVLAGQTPYMGDFVAHYLMPVLYPEGLTREMQIVMGAVVLLLTIAVYGVVIRRWRAARRRA